MLLKAGTRFDFNVVDTVCRRRLGLSWYVALLAEVILLCAFLGVLPSGLNIELNASFATELYLGLMSLLCMYIVWYAMRLSYYIRCKHILRKDRAPIVVEAYAIVCFDVKRWPLDNLYISLMSYLFRSYQRYAVVYKESGSEKPRFFLSAAVTARKLNYNPGQIARVFIDRKEPSLYSVDDNSAYQTNSARRYFSGELISSNASMSKNSTQGDAMESSRH